MDTSRKIHTEILVNGNLQGIFDSVATDPILFPKFFRGFFPIVPSIEEIKIPEGESIREGLVRSIRLGDGSKIKERVLIHKSPETQKYEMAEMNFIQKLFLINMQGEFICSNKEKLVLVEWNYIFFPKETLITKLAIPILVWSFRHAMENCLKNLKNYHEEKL